MYGVPFNVELREGMFWLYDLEIYYDFILQLKAVSGKGLIGSVFCVDMFCPSDTVNKFRCHLSYVCEETNFKHLSVFNVMGTSLVDGSLPVDGNSPCIQMDDRWNFPHTSVFSVCIVQTFDDQLNFDLEIISDEDYSSDSDRE